jgi:predicted transcriptional regulator
VQQMAKDEGREWLQESRTKHEQIIQYIDQLKVGTKISVRKIARDVVVSEGTAYRAIKEAENQGLVSTRERIGTVRVEKKLRVNIHKLTFGEIVQIVDGVVLGGSQGLDMPLNKFVIGAMEQDAMKRYIEPGSLLIVGNRYEAHTAALEQGAGVLITGGFDTTTRIKGLADQLNLPIISCGYDTFTVASMINRAIYDSMIKKKIMLVEDILLAKQKPIVLKTTNTVEEWEYLLEETGHTRYPVVDEWNRLVGMITSKDVVGAERNQTIDKLMTRNPLKVTARTSIASAAHTMVWEGIELLPVIDVNRKLIGVIGRQDVLKAMQFVQKQPQMGETIEELIWNGFEELKDERGDITFRGMITPQMTSPLGTASEGVLTTLMTKAAFRAIREHKRGDLVLENMSIYFMRPLQIETEIDIKPKTIEISRKFGKVEVAILHQDHLIAKAMMTAQLIDQS